MEFPKTDAEIRMYCLELSRDEGDFKDGKPNIDRAKQYYEFICPTPST